MSEKITQEHLPREWMEAVNDAVNKAMQTMLSAKCALAIRVRHKGGEMLVEAQIAEKQPKSVNAHLACKTEWILVRKYSQGIDGQMTLKLGEK